jgi:hypothetical protein
LVYFIPDFVGQFLPALKWLNVMVVVGIIVPIISYGVMPTVHFFMSLNSIDMFFVSQNTGVK